MKRFLTIIAIVAVGVAALLILGRKDTQAPNSSDSSSNSTSSIAKRTVGTGPVEVVEFADFQCPGCGSFYPIVKQVKEQNKEKITFKFKHFPLQSNHTNARAAARATEAAANQDKFFEMHDKLFAGQTDWEKLNNPEQTFQNYGKDLKLDVVKLKKDAASSAAKDSVSKDLASGTAAGVEGTPTFFINGKKISSPQSIEEFEKLLE
jgi:protein-disulfide isomerase